MTGTLDEFIRKTDGRYYFLNDELLKVALSILQVDSEPRRVELIRRFMSPFAGIGDFRVHFDGAGDALLLLSTFYDKSPHSSIVSVTKSPDSAKSLFEAFPGLERIYILPYPQNYIIHVLLRRLFKGMANCRGMGVTPVDPDYFREWENGLDISAKYGVIRHPRWVDMFMGQDSESANQVVIQPVGGISPLDSSSRKMIRNDELKEIIGLLNGHGIRPAIIGVPEERPLYSIESLEYADHRGMVFAKQMILIRNARLFIGADSWGKTFAALCEIPSIVFHSLRGEQRNGLPEVGDNVFLKPWPSISVVNEVDELRRQLIIRRILQPVL